MKIPNLSRSKTKVNENSNARGTSGGRGRLEAFLPNTQISGTNNTKKPLEKYSTILLFFLPHSPLGQRTTLDEYIQILIQHSFVETICFINSPILPQGMTLNSYVSFVPLLTNHNSIATRVFHTLSGLKKPLS